MGICALGGFKLAMVGEVCMSKDVGVGLARDCVQVSDQARGQGPPHENGWQGWNCYPGQ